jgi:hypothetical protein
VLLAVEGQAVRNGGGHADSEARAESIGKLLGLTKLKTYGISGGEKEIQ